MSVKVLTPIVIGVLIAMALYELAAYAIKKIRGDDDDDDNNSNGAQN